MTGKQRLGFKILAVVLGATLILSSFMGCVTEKKTIVFGDGGWDSAQVHGRIAAFILEHGYGYESEFVPGETIVLLEALVGGDIDVNMEIWVENQQEPYDAAIAAGDVVDLGGNFLDNWQGWVVPTYMIEDGDLPEGFSVYDMADYWELFKDPEDPTKGRFVNSVPGWMCTGFNTEKLETYGLTDYYTDFLAGTDAALSGSMVGAYEKHEPWIGYYWEPTWVLGKLDMTKVVEPEYDDEIWNTTRGCAYPANKVNVAVNADFYDTIEPGVIDFLTKYETTTEMNNQFLAYMQESGGTTEDAAIWFLQNYESVWTQWVPSDVASKVKDALP
jgi:glycine betaine/proline transport system substrate-binding protein